MNLPVHEQPVVDLREHESRRLSYGEIRRLGSGAKSITEQDKRFYDELKKKLDITELKDGLHIVAKQYVGVARFDGFTVNVHPKITFKNAVTLPRMIEFAHGGVDDSGVETEFVGGGDALREMLIRSIVKKTESLFRSGMHRSYVIQRHHTDYMRGQLLFDSVHMHDIAIGEARLWCEFDDISYDNPENRLVKTALEVCRRITTEPDMRRRISRLLSHMDSIVSSPARMSAVRVGRHYILNYTNTIDSSLPSNATKITYSRVNRHYEPIHRLCKLVLDSTGMSDLYGKHLQDVGQFFVNMNEVFERFVAQLFKKYYPPPVRTQKEFTAWRRPDVVPARLDIWLEDEDVVPARLDIWLEDEDVVLDTKYKVSKDNTPALTIADLYQIGFYAYVYGKGNRAYAVLPSVPNCKNEEKVIVSCSSKKDVNKLSIYTRYIDLDNVAELIYKREEDKLKAILKKMLVV